jgi:hypothetical protein
MQQSSDHRFSHIACPDEGYPDVRKHGRDYTVGFPHPSTCNLL